MRKQTAERKGTHMTIQLPRPISAYFQADRSDRASVSECFTDDAKVTDEGTTYSGRDAIRDWKAKSSKKYTYTVAPFAIEETGGKVVVTANVVGNFPGSPVDLRYFFVLNGEKIASLEVKL
jgi:hypothetical protein